MAISSKERVRAVVILGATSSVGRALADVLAARGWRLVLTGRRREEVAAVAADLRIRHGIEAAAHVLDALAYDRHPAAVDACLADAGDGLAGVVVCVGYLGDHAAATGTWDEARRILDTNFTAVVSLLNAAAHRLEARGGGFLCALSSVAGDRGRQGNYLYGAAKGGLNVYLQGLRHRLGRAGVRVITVKLGPVDTRMSYGRPEAVMAARPEAVARAIARAIETGKQTVYVPARWRWIMLAIRSIPEPIFQRLRI